VVFQNEYAMNIEFVSTTSGANWLLINIYASCSPEVRQNFLIWFTNIDTPEETDWLVIDDFNLIRR
jgi:hypothetical protein